MNKKTKKRRKENYIKKNKKTKIRFSKKIRQNKIRKNYKKTKKKIKRLKNKQIGGIGGVFSNKCKKKNIEEKYKIVFVKNQLGGNVQEDDKEKINISKSCRKKINDLEAEREIYINEWKKFS